MRGLLFAVAVATVFLPAKMSAQQTPARAAAALVLAEGTVSIEGKEVEPNAMPFVLPDVAAVRTAGNRAVIELKRGGWLFLDKDSSVRVRGNGVYNFNRIEVVTGTAVVASATSTPLVDCESQIRLSSPGIFRFDAQPADASGGRTCRFRVYEGAAAVPLTTVTNALRPGQSMMCDRRCGDMIPTMEFSTSQLDAFDQWARRMLEQIGR